MNLTQIKTLFRKKIKVVAGGPTNVTRGVDMLDVLNALAEWIKDAFDFASRGPNPTPSAGYKQVVFLTKADAIAAGRPDCATLEELDPLTLCTGTVVRVDLYPGAPGTELILVYDTRADQSTAGGIRAYIDGNFQLYKDLTPDGLNPLKWVKKGSLEAVLAGIRRYDAAYAKWGKDETMKIDFGGTDAFFSAVAAGGPFPAPTAAGVATADWKPAAKPGAQQEVVTVHELRALAGSYEPGQQYRVLNAPVALGASLLTPQYGDTGPALLFAMDEKTLAPYGVSDGVSSGNSDGVVQVYERGSRNLLLLVVAAPGDGVYVGEYQEGQYYEFRQLVSYQETLYTPASGGFTAPAVFDLAQWRKVSGGGSGGGAGTVTSVNGQGPNASGDVVLPQRDIYAFSQAKYDQVLSLFSSPTQFKAVDVPLAGDTSTGIGSRIADLVNGDLYELVPDPFTPMPDPADPNKLIATPTWLRTSFS
jgi:hypothetical protein